LASDGLNHISAAFLPDGKRFVFTGTEPGHGVRLYWESLDDPNAHAISGEGIVSGIVLSPDGKFVATRGPDQKVYLFPVEGGEPKLVPGMLPAEFATAWSGDGHSLFVMARGQVPAQVFRVDVATGQRTLWKTVEPADAAGIDTVGRLMMSADNKSYLYSYVRTLSDLYLVQGLK
jgi:Tol biopolymer transport system component